MAVAGWKTRPVRTGLQKRSLMVSTRRLGRQQTGGKVVAIVGDRGVGPGSVGYFNQQPLIVEGEGGRRKGVERRVIAGSRGVDILGLRANEDGPAATSIDLI